MTILRTQNRIRFFNLGGGGTGGGGGGGAPTDATYLTATANGTLSSEVVWGTLGFYAPDTLANRPAASATISGAIYFATDAGGSAGLGALYRSDGVSVWERIAIDKEYADSLYYGPGGTDVAVADGGTGSSTAAGARTNLGLGTGDSPQFTAVEVGNASDTTLARFGAGDVQVEGNRIFRVGGTDVPIADGGTGQSTATAAFDALSPNTTRGDLTVRGASNNVRLAVGAADTFLGSDGTDPSWVAGSSIGSLAGFGTQVYSNPGATVNATASATTVINGAKYDIAANNPVVGDTYIVEAWGTHVQNSGAGRDLTIEFLADAVSLGQVATSAGANTVAASANTRNWYVALRVRVDAIGGTGVFNCSLSGYLSSINSGFDPGTFTTSSRFIFEKYTAATVDTTQALTLDLKFTHSTNSGSITSVCEGLRIIKHNAP